MRKRLVSLLFAGIMACSVIGSGVTTFAAENDSHINLALFTYIEGMDPATDWCGWNLTRCGVGETLVTVNENMEIVGQLADEWEQVDDTTYRFHIRQGVKFSNGTELTPEIVKDSIQRSIDNNSRGGDLKIANIEVDGENVVFTTDGAYSAFVSQLTEPMTVIVDTTADTSNYDTMPICTGPYAVSEYVSEEKIELVANENYWDGEVPLDKVTLKCVDDQTTRSMALQTGEIDIAYNLKTENLVEFEGNDNYDIQELQSLRSTYAFMNQNEDHALSDKALRQALLRGLDKETYCNTLLEGGATAGKAPVPPTLDFGFDDLKDENSYDPDSAKKILDEAGYKDVDGDGFVETPDGDPLVLDFVIYTSRAELGVYAQAAQASLKEIGINVNLNTVSYETLLDMRDSGQYDLLIWNVLVANTGDPENYLRENWYSSSANNTTGYNNPEVDKLLDELAQTFDEDKRKDLIIDIQQDIMDDAATVFFGYETTYLFSNKKVTGVKMYPMDYYWLTKDITLAE